MAGKWSACRRPLQRKIYTPEQLEASPLRRCLGFWEVSALGVGSSLGAGVYALVGAASLPLAGPALVLSFLIAGVAALFAGLCYAEFGSRVPRAGAAYAYTFVAVGEFAAFLVGWINIFESVFATAGLARGLSVFVDTAANGSMSRWFAAALPLDAPPLSPHFDLFAFLLVILLGALVCGGARAASAAGGVLAAVNLATIVFIVGAGAFAADTANWSIPEEEVPAGHGSGGFAPHGAWGVLRAAAVCFYGFAGFDCVSAAAEEVKDPRRNIPSAILSVFGLSLLAYAGVAVVVTMMVPYYQQDAVTAVVATFSVVGWEWARWIVTVGAVFGISSSLVGALFPLPRLIYSMAADGLLPRVLARVSGPQAPIVATLVPTAVIAILAGILELDQLILMMCVGTLLSYTVVAVCVILLRYRSNIVSEKAPGAIRQILGCGHGAPTRASAAIVYIVLLLFICAALSSALVWRMRPGPAALGVLGALALLLFVLMAVQPRVKADAIFTTPLFPLIPMLSIYINIHLMIFISFETWTRILIWIAIGIPIYILFACCCRRKKENKLEENIIEYTIPNKNEKAQIQIVVESPTPPGTMDRTSNSAGDLIQVEDIKKDIVEMQEKHSRNEIVPYETEEIVVQHAAVIENNEEREAKIIDMLDKVLQAEEDSYGEIISLKDPKEEEDPAEVEVVEKPTHRKSFSEVSDADSDASLGQVLSKYDVIAQVHREDLPRVAEEKPDSGEADILENNGEESEDHNEHSTETNDSDTNSQTDESGYSDTIDKTVLNDSSEDFKDVPYIPTPPPFDASFFASPSFQKSYTVPKRPSKNKPYEEPEENKPRESVQSNGQGDGNIIFGSDRQINFMSKLNDIFQVKIATPPDDGEEKRKRSNSTGNVVENNEFSVNRDRPVISLDLKKEILAAKKLRQVNTEEKEAPVERADDDIEEREGEDTSMSRNDLKSKLENIFANGGPQLLKPRLMKSNPPTPEEAYQTDSSSTESISKLPKMDKNDTLKRQKDKFGAVLNSFRLSLHKDDEV